MIFISFNRHSFDLQVAPLHFVVTVCVQGVESNAYDCKQLAQMCKEAIQQFDCPVKKALDVMCSMGRFSYELSNYLEEVRRIILKQFCTVIVSSWRINLKDKVTPESAFFFSRYH